ncbi:hypothetical protein HWV62_15118 [Athelia sp. TMB]|nr:hypothetical protein HWV62_15118 [Athelia sp. TMB]
MPQIKENRRFRILSLSKRLEEIAAEKRKHFFHLVNLSIETKAVQLEYDRLQNVSTRMPRGIHSVPDEILAMIFEAGRGPHFGLLVSRVSHRWRAIALTSPRLWAHIRYITPPGKPGLSPEVQIDRGATYLARSGVAPVDVRINSNYQTNQISLSADVLQAISKHMGNCWHLSVVDVGSISMRGILDYISRQPAPFLRSIKLYAPSGLVFSSPFLPRGAPLLRTVQLNGVDNLNTFTFCFTALQSVTHLRLTGMSIINMETYSTFRALLMSLQSLNHLEVKLIGWQVAPLPFAFPIVLPTLQILAVDYIHPLKITETIHAASLKSLSLAGRLVEYDTSPDMPTHYHYPQLEHLVLASYYSRDLAEFPCLPKRFPDIQRLTCLAFKDAKLADIRRMFEIIVGGHEPDSSPRWSSLQSIGISAVHKQAILPALVSIISKLKEAGHPFRSLLIPKDTKPEAGALGELIEIGEFYNDWPTIFPLKMPTA